jgi:hypothetical protein
MEMRLMTLVAVMLVGANTLSACVTDTQQSSATDRLNEAFGALSPEVAARNNERAARKNYNQSVANYRNCLAANPSNGNACEGQRHIMEADEKVLSAAVQRPSSTNVYVQGR